MTDHSYRPYTMLLNSGIFAVDHNYFRHEDNDFYQLTHTVSLTCRKRENHCRRRRHCVAVVSSLHSSLSSGACMKLQQMNMVIQ